MDVCFLLGPAGSGKTWRCLESIRARLQSAPEGAPLILLAPKQATFQLERQLLADPTLAGYSRLRILSFERLAEYVFDQLGVTPPSQLNEEGRVMMLRALLGEHRPALHVFRASARLPGFARQLSQVLRELRQNRMGPGQLEQLAEKVGPAHRLDEKLRDLALLLRAYADRVKAQGLQDGESLLDLAATLLRSGAGLNQPPPRFPVEALWMDGFAQMTPQERHLLLALLPHCQEATLAFCLDAEPRSEPAWYSPWTMLAQTYRQCRQEVEGLEALGVRTKVEVLPRRAANGRFASSPALQHLERWWNQPRAMLATSEGPAPIRVLECAHPEQELVAVAREIRRFVRDGGRYRDVAVLVRQLETYHDVARRVLSRYDIPYFLDRRERVAHHPLAELTRCALRTLAFHWRHDDWFGALKSGLVRVSDSRLDWLENEALEHGWEGGAWHRDLVIRRRSKTPEMEEALNQLRRELIEPFQGLQRRAGETPTGRQLSEALRRFWEDLKAGRTLERWSQPADGEGAEAHHAAHGTVWDQMQAWLDNLALAFPEQTLSMPDWLPILEAGLEGLTVGVIPPVLDQVLVGAIDRSRNPDLKQVFVLGLNESVFPAAPPSPLLLTERDRDRLEEAGRPLGPTSRHQLGHERFYGYIACTRARERLVCTYARQDAHGQVLNPSGFIRHLQRLFPWLTPEAFAGARRLSEVEHACEMVGPILQHRAQPHERPDPALDQISGLPLFRPLLERLRHLHPANQEVRLEPALAGDLYGPVLRTSVSRLERFGHCPFRHFVDSGLRVEERKRFELDVRQQGSFMHEVLKVFHEELEGEERKWRDLTPEEGARRIGRICDALTPQFEHGLLEARGHHRFLAAHFKASLQQFIQVVLGWMAQYEFDPVQVELGFGGEGDPLPAWELELEGGRRLALRGRMDRVDVWPDPSGNALWCVVMDYKSGSRKPDRLHMEHGLELQLTAYLNVLHQLPEAAALLGAAALEPAGVFYVGLRPNWERGKTRSAVVGSAETSLKDAYQHQGLFDLALRPHLDNRPGAASGDQFAYRLTKDGLPYANTFGCLGSETFRDLLDMQTTTLRRFGIRIYEGDVAIDPWKKGEKSACTHCDLASVCRIDPWTHAYRQLAPLEPRTVAKPKKAAAKRGRGKKAGGGEGT